MQLGHVCRDFHELFGSTSLIWKLLYRRDLSERNEPTDGAYKKAYLKMMRLIDPTREQFPFDRAMFFAAANGYEKLAKRIIQRSNWRNNEAMSEAAKHGHFEIIKLLQSHGASSYWYSAICAAAYGHLDILKFMLDLGPTDYNGALRTAAGKGYTKIVELLLARGATDYNEAMIEAAHGHYDIVKMMLDRGARRYSRALDGAFRANRRDIVELLLSRGGEDYDRCLIWAAEAGHADLVDQMLVRVAEQAVTISHYDAPQIYRCAINCALTTARKYSENSQEYQHQLNIVDRIIASWRQQIPNMPINSLY
jgi:ankyrin repeat protein